jgi:Zn-dependent alcohol dehydrogenase
MKAAVCRQFGQPLAIEEVGLSDPGPGEVKVRLRACAICHSDIFYMQGAWGGELPAVYGHEAAGVVEAVGAGAAAVKPGDHVIVTLIRHCGHCPSCVQGEQVLCETRFPLDGKGPLTATDGAPIHQGLRTGAFAEQVVVDASQAVAIPKDIPLDSAALIACGVLTGVGAVTNTAAMPAGSTVAVIGTGGVGLNTVQGAALAGGRTIVAIDVAADKLAAAERFGATHTVDARSQDAAQAVLAATGGRGVDYAFVTVGAPKVVEQGFALIRRGGTLVLVGMPASGVMASFDPGTFAAYGQRVLGSKMGSARIETDVPRIIDFYRQGRLKLDELITGRYPLAAINEAVAGVVSGAALRNVIVF